MVTRALMGLCSASVLIIIVWLRKRVEFLYVATPICFLIAGFIGAITEVLDLINTNEGNSNVVADL